MDIVQMTSEHVAAIAALETTCFSSPWSENAITGELSNPLSLWLVAQEGGEVLGYVGSQSVMGEADMMNLAVAPHCRRKGVAKQLVEKLIVCLREQKVYSLTLEVRASNSGAIALYDSLGFCQVGRRPRYYTAPKEDALILRKEWEA